MNKVELIDRMCEIMSLQSNLLRELAFFIIESETVDEETKKKFAEKFDSVNEKVDFIENEIGTANGTARQEGGHK